MVMAFIWGLLEATLFFIIPDVLLTFIAIHGFSVGLYASLLALAGALLGGTIMYVYAKHDFSRAYLLIGKVPSVGEKMLDDVEQSVTSKGIVAMITGPIRGIPYKIFAIYAPKVHIRYMSFLLASIPARFTRFFLTSVIAWLLANVLFDALPMWMKYCVWGIVWIIVYTIYFSIHPWQGKSNEAK